MFKNLNAPIITQFNVTFFFFLLLTIICVLFNRIERRSRLRMGPSCANTVCPFELQCIKDLIYVLVMFVIIIQIK